VSAGDRNSDSSGCDSAKAPGLAAQRMCLTFGRVLGSGMPPTVEVGRASGRDVPQLGAHPTSSGAATMSYTVVLSNAIEAQASHLA
jgi:hypothetical protein